jgi:hypothetical protein
MIAIQEIINIFSALQPPTEDEKSTKGMTSVDIERMVSLLQDGIQQLERVRIFVLGVAYDERTATKDLKDAVDLIQILDQRILWACEVLAAFQCDAYGVN